MLNENINSRFQDWLLNPHEGLDFEVKQWLDVENADHQGIIAKALIALENHGGGFFLIGYRDANGVLSPDPDRPPNLDKYSTDNINSIIKRRAEPSFHVHVSIQKHPTTGEEFPLIHVAGDSKVPVRSDSSNSTRSLDYNVYYIRAPGPESRGPKNEAEWDNLLRKSIRKQRAEILDLLRNVIGSELDSSQPITNSTTLLEDFHKQNLELWAAKNSSLPVASHGKNKHGYYAFSAKLVGKNKELTALQLRQANIIARRYTGLPVFSEGVEQLTKTKPNGNFIETWLAPGEYADVGTDDFWRISTDGEFFMVRGFQEDANRFNSPDQIGKLFYVTLPIWRVAEFLTRVSEIGDVMMDGDFDIAVRCEWSGLANRRLTAVGGRRTLFGNYISSTDRIVEHGLFKNTVVNEFLPETVQKLTTRLYQQFSFFDPPKDIFSQEISEMLNTRY